MLLIILEFISCENLQQNERVVRICAFMYFNHQVLLRNSSLNVDLPIVPTKCIRIL